MTTEFERQREVRARFNEGAGIHFLCSECDLEGYTEDDPVFAHCREMRHAIFKMAAPVQEKPQKKSHQDIVLFIMAERHFKTLHKTHEILFYDNGVYRYGAEEIISQRCRMLEPKCSKHDISEITAMIQDKTGYHRIDEFDADENLINVRNGIVNLQTGTLEPHDPKYLTRVQLDVDYDPHVIAVRFLRFIGTAHNEPRDIYRIFEMMGACLIRDNRWLTKAWMHLGQGSNGKSRLFDILGAVLGEQTITSHSIHDIEKNRFALASLDGKLANICGDIEEDELTKTGNLKKVIAGDVMPAEKKFMSDYNFRPFCKLIFSANGLPVTPDESDGFARRFEIIEWTKQFYGKDRDYSIFTIMYDQKELTGVLNIMVNHAKILLKNRHLKFETPVAEMKARWKERSSSAERFVNEECVLEAGLETEKTRLYSEYISFCGRNQLTKMGKEKFINSIEKLGISDQKTRRNGESVRVCLGVGLRKDITPHGQARL